MQVKTIPVITIDGPSGSGKGTLSLLLAKRLGWHFLDSGAIYRALAYAVLEQAIDKNDDEAICKLAYQLSLFFEEDTKTKASKIFLHDQEITERLRAEAVGSMASQVAVHSKVRAALLQIQRDFLKSPGLVADGRDMGTVVFPKASHKFFLTASLEERARRRYKQLQQTIAYEAILAELSIRDQRDKQRSVAPLKPAEDAILIDTTGLSVEEVLEAVWRSIR